MSGQQSDMGFPGDRPVKVRRVRQPGAKPADTRRARYRGIEVTAEDIAGAMKEHSHMCMIAQAIKRQIPEVKMVGVDVQSITFTDVKKQRRVACLTPQICQAALVRFDKGMVVKPFTFDLQTIQVAAMYKYVPKLDADGNPVKVDRKQRARLADGSVVERTVSATVKRAVAVPTETKEVAGNATSVHAIPRRHFVGGKMPRKHLPSYHRQFGMKRFTWDDDEDFDVVGQRLEAAWGDVAVKLRKAEAAAEAVTAKSEMEDGDGSE